jgi:NADPH-dependent curcumin reductase CurA
MTPVRNRRIILSSRPESLPTEANYSMTEAEVPVPGEGEVLARILMLSIDPAMRGWVLETPNYAPPVPVGDVMRSFGVAEVVESKSSKYQVGDIVTAMTGWQEWRVLTDDNIQRRVDRPMRLSRHQWASWSHGHNRIRRMWGSASPPFSDGVVSTAGG